MDEEKALGINWHMFEDLFSVRADVVLGGGRTGQEVTEVLVKKDMSLILNPEIKLSLRICLPIHPKAYDPLWSCLSYKVDWSTVVQKDSPVCQC